MSKRLFNIILGSVSLVLVITISISVFWIVNTTGNKKLTKKSATQTKWEYADEGFVDYIDNVIEDVANDMNSDYDFDNDVSDDVPDNSEETKDEIIDDLGWLEDDEKEKIKYVSAIQKNGKMPADQSVRNINVSVSQAVYDDFYGLGGCLFPEILSDDAVGSGYNSVAWEFERQKLVNAKPRFSRVLIDIDAIVTDIEEDDDRIDFENNADYKNYMEMCYDFNNDSANSLWATLDVLKAAGTTVLFNAGWKCDERIKIWYPDVPSGWASSAPYDINAFIRANICWLLEIQRRGYIDNIDFLVFGNETTWGGDFKTNTDFLKYHTVLVSTMTKALEYAQKNEISYYSYENGQRVERKTKLKKDIKMLAVDTVPGSEKLIETQKELVDSLNKLLGDKTPVASSIHKYYSANITDDIYGTGSYSNAYDVLSELRETVGKQLITEFFASPALIDKDLQISSETGGIVPGRWETSYASYFIVAANTGSMGLSNWAYGTSYYPVIYQLNSYTAADGAGALFAAQKEPESYRVTANYRLAAMLQHTVPQGSDVLKVDWEGNDLRVAAFRLKNGGYTFVIEADKSDTDRTIKLNLDESIGKKLYKYSFIDAEGLGHNDLQGILLQPEKTLDVDKYFTDKLSGEYGVYVYSTVAPVKQIVLDKALEEVEAGSSITFNASLLNCDDSSEIEWSVNAASKLNGDSLVDKNILGEGDGKINSTALTVDGNDKRCKLTVPSTMKSGDSIAVRATLKGETETYSVVVVYVK